MPVTIEVTYEIKLNDSPPWKIFANALRQIESEWFVKLRPYDISFIRLVAHDFIELPKRQRMSLAACAGFKALLKLRNDAAIDNADDPHDDDKDALSLFGSSSVTTAVETKKVKRPRLTAAKLQALRDSPTSFEFSVPGTEGNPALMVTAIRPAHPCDELCVKLDAGTIEQLVLFIRDGGVSVEDLGTRRSYGTVGEGVWKNGSAGYIKKLAQSDELDDDKSDRKRKYQSLNAQETLLTDHQLEDASEMCVLQDAKADDEVLGARA